MATNEFIVSELEKQTERICGRLAEYEKSTTAHLLNLHVIIMRNEMVMNNIEKIVSAKKTKKTADANTPSNTPTTETAVAEKWYSNKLYWFKARYAADTEFRALYLKDTFKDEVLKDEKVIKKKDDKARFTAEADIVWKKIKGTPLYVAAEQQHDKEKAAFTERNKPAALTADVNSNLKKADPPAS